jgi:DNA primase
LPTEGLAVLVFIDQFIDWAHAGLLENEEAQSYLSGRGSSRDQWSRHRLGFISGDFDVDPGSYPGHSFACLDFERKHLWCDACRYRHWSSTWEALEGDDRKTQIVGRRIRNCIVLPLTSYSGSIVGFQTRSLSEKSYDTFVVSRRPEGYFFGCQLNFREIWSKEEVLLVEGAMDQLLLERLVASNVLAITTSGLSKLQLKYVLRFAKRVLLCLDLDEAGRKGTNAFIKQHGSYLDVVNVRYPRVGPKDKDPGDYWKKVGDEAFSRTFAKSLGRNS